MNFADYAKIGKKLKAENPGKWEGNTDEEVGLVHVKVNGSAMSLEMPDIEVDFRGHETAPLALNTDPFGFLGIRINHLDKQIRHIGLQAQKERVIASEHFAHAHHQQELELQHRLHIAQHVLTMLTARQHAELTQLATAHQLDNTSYLIWRVQELTRAQEREHQEQMNRIELDKAERQKKIDYEHEQRMFHAKVGSAVDYSNQPHLIWMRKNQDLKNLYRDVEETNKDEKLTAAVRERTINRIEKQIKKLEAELDGLGGQAVPEDSGS